MDIQKILKKVRELPRSYWRERFIELDENRQSKVDDTLSGFEYLLLLTMQEIHTHVSSYYGKHIDETPDSLSLSISKSERAKIISDIDSVIERMQGEGKELDKDIAADVQRLKRGARFSELDALKLYTEVFIDDVFTSIENIYYRHNADLMNDFYYGTVFEIFFAAGYGDKNLKTLSQDVIDSRFDETWRTTGENFSDMLWRYKRTLIAETKNNLQQIVDLSVAYEIFEDNSYKTFRRHLRNLKMQLRTDSTYFSTRGQEEAFVNLGIEEAVFTAVMDERTTIMCRTADGTIIPVDEIRPWINSPPLHENCRSTLIPIVLKLDYLTGDVYAIEDESMDTWYDQYRE